MSDLSAETVAMRGTRITFAPPAQWKDREAGAQGVVVTEATCDSSGDWHVLVRFDGTDRWRSVDVDYLRINP